MSTISVAVIDDHPLFREGVIHSLSEGGRFRIVGQGGSIEEALSIAAEKRPDIILMDLSMPGGGLNALTSITEQHPEQKVVVLTVSEDGDDMATAIRRGAKGYVVKGVGSRALGEILRLVAAGQTYISPTLTAKLVAKIKDPEKRLSDGISNLNAREIEILGLVTSGLSNKRIALRLGLQEKTIKHYMTRIMQTLAVSNRTEAAIVFRDSIAMSAR